jgi:hypothetical protein
MKVVELQQCTLIQDWLAVIKTKSTKSNYLNRLQAYTDWIGKIPDELVDEAEEEAQEKMLKRHIKSDLINFKAYLAEKELVPLTIRNYLTGVRAFYTFFDIELPNLPKDTAKTLKENKEIPTKEDLQQ